ncbi:hypothetical protein [Reichenbachiella sp. 5M10]|uniref:hypothetical protein n=1 Tax=Reichenbachiella sp. 5M10 TaxID=1889772 RepID=UPI00117A3FEA|nr:hypothetical protein [Reichenbachiella sp. 5M10]
MPDTRYAQLVTFISYSTVFQTIIDAGTVTLGPRYHISSSYNIYLSDLIIYRFGGLLLTIGMIFILQLPITFELLIWAVFYFFTSDWIFKARLQISEWSFILFLGTSVGILTSIVFIANNEYVIWLLRVLPACLVAVIGWIFSKEIWIEFSVRKRIAINRNILNDVINSTSGALLNRLNSNLGFIISGFYLPASALSEIGLTLIIYNSVNMLKGIINQSLFPFVVSLSKNINIQRVMIVNLLVFFIGGVSFVVGLKLILMLEIDMLTPITSIFTKESPHSMIFLMGIVTSILLAFFNFSVLQAVAPLKVIRIIAFTNFSFVMALLTGFVVFKIRFNEFTLCSLFVVESVSMLQSYFFMVKYLNRI